MSFSSFGTLGRTAQALEKKGAVAVLFVQLEDPMGLSDVLNYLALAPGKDSLSPRLQGAGNEMEMLAELVAAGGGAPALVLSVQASAQLLQEIAVDREALLAFCRNEGERPAAKADVEAQHKGTAKARADARIAHADADYDVAKEKCDELTGNKKDVCMKDAKAAHAKAKADAKVARSANEPRNEGTRPGRS